MQVRNKPYSYSELRKYEKISHTATNSTHFLRVIRFIKSKG